MNLNISNSELGAWKKDDGSVGFNVWAPLVNKLELKIVAPYTDVFAMNRVDYGYWRIVLKDQPENLDYFYLLNGEDLRPDPASHHQPSGVHQHSRVVDHARYAWSDSGWKGIPLAELIIYELHVGTFTPDGTFDAVITRLQDLKELGVNAIELMPVAQFPGERNWGYDGVHPFAPQNSYGGPDGLKRLIDAAHQNGFSIILDVVYNHLGPEGNYLHQFAPYFTDRYKAPWGMALNFDGPHSDNVRNYFIQNALYWFNDYHIDALRLDAIHGIFDFSAKTFLRELSDSINEVFGGSEPPRFLIAESDLNDIRTITPSLVGGDGMDCQWSDDFHHSLHTILTGENQGYYIDFGRISDLAKAFREGFVYDWRYSKYRKKHHGSSSAGLPGDKFIISIQNHDQVGNRLKGERLTNLVSFEALKLAAVCLFISPYIPMIFMGEEYAEHSPFLFFVSHLDSDLIQAVREGRKREFASFGWKDEPSDPQSEQTFNRSKLKWETRHSGKHKIILELYKFLISLKKTHVALKRCDKDNIEVVPDEQNRTIVLRYDRPDNCLLAIMNFADNTDVVADLPGCPGYYKILDTADKAWDGPGTNSPDKLDVGHPVSLKPRSAIIYTRG